MDRFPKPSPVCIRAPFKVPETNRNRSSVIRLGVEEFRWLAREIMLFCSAKGDPLW